jgi:hypothetical protein
VKRQVLISQIGEAAKRASTTWLLVREGKSHEIWQCGSTKVSIPRHREINELTAQGIWKELQAELGERWWQ